VTQVHLISFTNILPLLQATYYYVETLHGRSLQTAHPTSLSQNTVNCATKTDQFSYLSSDVTKRPSKCRTNCDC